MVPSGDFRKEMQVINAVVGGVQRIDAARNASAMSDAMKDCVEQKQKLTGEIVAARQAARGQRAKLVTLEVLAKSLAKWLQLLDASNSLMPKVDTSIKDSCTDPLSSAQASYNTSLQEAMSQFGNAKATVAKYMASGKAPPEASPLPEAMLSIEAALVAMRDKVPSDVQAVLSSCGDVTLGTAGASKNLGTLIGNFQKVQPIAQSLVTSTSGQISSLEKSEQDKMAERVAVEVRCEETLNVTGLLEIRSPG